MGSVERQFEECIRKGNIKAFGSAAALVEKELKIAAADLAEAQSGLDRSRWKWSTIQAYYSMFHTARGLLFAKGFREQSHHCLRVAIAHLYGDEGEEFQRLVETLQLAKRMRENADYADDFSDNSAKKITKAAQDFLSFAQKITRP